MENNQNKKIVFIPGWMKSLKFYDRDFGLDVWLDKKEFSKKLEAEILIGHSLGTNIALNKYSPEVEKIILVNPVVTKRNFLDVGWSWVKFALTEKPAPDKNVPFRNFFASLPIASRLAKKNYEGIVSGISEEKIFVLRGKNDKYLCDQKCVDFFRKFGINVLEIEGAGHNWNDAFEREIERIINS